MSTVDRKALRMLTLLTALTICLAGCGGGGSDGGSQPAPAQQPPETPKAAPGADGGTPGPTGSASIRGTVRFEGEAPPERPVKMDADPGCAKKHSTPPPSEALVLGENNGMSHVLVRVSGGLPGGSYPPPSEAAVLDQDGCRYVPHVLGVMKGQPIKVLNSDGLLHNVHALPKVNKEFNMAMPGSRTETEVTFSEAEEMFKIKCDVHPWMASYVAVMSHPYFAVTGEDGKFSIPNVPAGTYTVEAWHEKLGTQTGSVTVGDGGASVDFKFSAPAPKS